MQALKQAARENDSTRLDALCEAWSVSAAAIHEAQPEASLAAASLKGSEIEKSEPATVSEAGVETRQ
jgi:hypothetical protein